MELLWSIVTTVVWWLISWVWWVLVKLFWLLVWFVLPFCVLAFGAVKLAEHLLGRAVVHGWLKQQALKWGGGIWRRLRIGTVAVSALPFRVLIWLVVYTLWHSLLSLAYTPRWKPWTRAWDRRWRPPPKSPGLPKSTSRAPSRPAKPS
jgi:hypothetical protein